MSHWSSLRPIEIISSLHSSCTLLLCHHSTWQRDRAGKRRREDEQLLHCPPLVLWSIDSPGLYERVVILDIIKQVFISRRLGKRNSIKLQGLLSYWEFGRHSNSSSLQLHIWEIQLRLYWDRFTVNNIQWMSILQAEAQPWGSEMASRRWARLTSTTRRSIGKNSTTLSSSTRYVSFII